MNTLHILIDSREQTPLVFPAEFTVNGRDWRVDVERVALPTGDYSLRGFGGRKPVEFPGICVERKAGWDELAHNFTKDRERLRREFYRMSKFTTRLFIVGQLPSAMAGMRSQMDPESLLNSLRGWSHDFNVPVEFYDGHAQVGVAVLFALRHFAERTIVRAMRKIDRPEGVGETKVEVDAGYLSHAHRLIVDLDARTEYLESQVAALAGKGDE